MNTAHSYGAPAAARDGTRIPAFADGQTMYSRYAPEKDAKAFAAAFVQSFGAQKDGSAAGYAVVLGLGSGLHIRALLSTGVQKIIVLEENESAVAFLKASFPLDDLFSDERVLVCTAAAFEQVITDTYIPALYGNAVCLPQRVWADHHRELASQALAVFKRAVLSVSADFSTQAHFGKIWYRNIIQNLMLAGNLRTCTVPTRIFDKLYTAKKAFVAGAGPSLAAHLPFLAAHRQDFCVIAADTAVPPLVRSGILPDIAVTLDGQQVSQEHFYFLDACTEPPDMLIAADLGANSTLTRRLARRGCPILFTFGGHPLAQAAALYMRHTAKEQLVHVNTDSGTVLMAALDIAVQLGFSAVLLAGADFGYTDGKPYACGTYLDSRYHAASYRLRSAEQAFVSLMYRGETIYTDKNFFSTPILQQYCNSYLTYRQKHADVCIMRLGYEPSGIYKQTAQRRISCSIPQTVSYTATLSFIGWFKHELAGLIAAVKETADISAMHCSPVFHALLPLIAYYRRNFPEMYTHDACFRFMELAYAQISRYSI